MTKTNLLFRRFPKTEKQAIIYKTFQFLTVAVITYTDNRNFGDLYASNKISDSSSISSGHSVYLIHNQHGFGMLGTANFN